MQQHFLSHDARKLPQHFPFVASASKLLRLGPRTWVFNTWLLGRPGIAHFCGLGGLGGPKILAKRWGASRPIFWKGFLGRRGRPDSKIDDSRPASKPSIKTRVPFYRRRCLPYRRLYDVLHTWCLSMPCFRRCMQFRLLHGVFAPVAHC